MFTLKFSKYFKDFLVYLVFVVILNFPQLLFLFSTHLKTTANFQFLSLKLQISFTFPSEEY